MAKKPPKPDKTDDPPVVVVEPEPPPVSDAPSEPVPTAESVPVRVARLLAASREAHLRKKRFAGVVDQGGTVTSAPDYPKAESHIAEALRLRLEANALDPQHTAPEWAADQVINKGITDAQLIEWFRVYPTIP